MLSRNIKTCNFPPLSGKYKKNICYVYVCLLASTSHTLGAHGDQERISESQNLVTDVCELPNRGQEWDLSILQGKQGFLFVGSSLWAPDLLFLLFKKVKDGAGEMSLQSRSLSTLPEKYLLAMGNTELDNVGREKGREGRRKVPLVLDG